MLSTALSGSSAGMQSCLGLSGKIVRLWCRCVELMGNDPKYLVVAWVTGKWHTLSAMFYRDTLWEATKTFVHH